MTRLLLLLAVLLPAAAAAHAQTALLKPFGAGPVPAAPWAVVGLPSQTKPYTRFEGVDLEGQRVLRVDAQESFGNLVHRLRLETTSATLAWRWRVDQLAEAADLHKRTGDDTALKVCVFFDQPMELVPASERPGLRLARQRKPEVPAATICYVWDNRIAVDTVLPNAFTPRMRYIVLESGSENLRAWRSVRRDVAADFLRVFGSETKTLPPILGVGIGGDADNTKSRSVAYIADLVLQR